MEQKDSRQRLRHEALIGGGKEESGEDTKTKKMDRTSAGLRNAIFDEIDSLREGSSNPARARSLAMLANTALKSVEVEIEFHKYVSDVSKFGGGAKIGILELGGGQLSLSGSEDGKPKAETQKEG